MWTGLRRPNGRLGHPDGPYVPRTSTLTTLVVWAAISIPKELPKNIIIIFLVNRSTFIRIALIHSMLICDVNTMRNFVFQAIMKS
jgi:hypothetical protein